MALTLQQLEYTRHKYFKKYHPYKMVYFADYDFDTLKRNILIKKRPGREDSGRTRYYDNGRGGSLWTEDGGKV